MLRRLGDELFKQLSQPIFHPQVVTIIGGILGDQDQLVYAQILEEARLLQDHIDRAAGKRAFDQRDGAEGAGTTAAIRNLQIGAATLPGDQLRSTFIAAHARRLRQVVERFGVLARAELLDQIDNVHPTTGSQDAIDAGRLADNFGAIALGQAACSDQDLPFAFVGSQIS